MTSDHKTLIAKDAVDIVEMLKKAEVSPLELIDAIEARTDQVNPAVNAIATSCFDRARSHATAIMKTPIDERGVLAGLPLLIKDLSAVKGVRSTQGSLIYKDHIPQSSDHVVTNLEAAGGIVSGKSNTPEFGAGANTFNDVFGATVNPWNTSLSAAGSSGGSAVALATGMAWLAHGSDLGGSLRNPASFNGVVGMRPSPFRVATGPNAEPFNCLNMEGPMARRVADLALMLDAMAVSDRRVPLSLEAPEQSFLSSAQECNLPKRVAFSLDLGITPVDPKVAAVCQKAVQKLIKAGVDVIEDHPDLSAAHDAFQILRAANFAANLRQVYETKRDQLKPEVVWNIEKGLALTSLEIAHAEAQRAKIYHNAERFMRDVDLLITPATIVPPYPVEERYVTSCDGVEFETYIDWLAIAYAISLTALPALSLPCGMTDDGLPIGLQLVGQPRGEAGLLSHANFMQNILGAMPTPILPKAT